MKTTVEYEASDIRLTDTKAGVEGDPLHDALVAPLIITLLVATTEPKDPTDPMGRLRAGMAVFLTALEGSDYALVRREVIRDQVRR